MTEPQPNPGQPVSPAPPATPGTPALDPVTVLRSRAYLSALVLAAILGIPISAAAYGFLALVATSSRAGRRPGGRCRGSPCVDS